MKFDMHCHTKEGSVDAKLPIEEYIKILISKGFDGMMISDHTSYNGYRYYKKMGLDEKYPDFVVLKGIEYDTLDAGHILVLLPNHISLKILEIKWMPVKLLIDIVHHHGGILGPAHPYGIRYQSIINTMKQHKQMQYLKQFDFVEKFNACESEEANHKAQYLAKTYNLPGFGGSDAHKASCAGLAYTEFPTRAYIKSNNDLIKFIKKDGKDIEAGGTIYGKTFKSKAPFVFDVLIQSYWVYNKGGGLINRFRHNRHLRKMYLKEILQKKEDES